MDRLLCVQFARRRLSSFAATVMFALVFSVVPVANAGEPTFDQELQMIRSLTEAQRQATLAANIELNEAEADAFWPVYRDYRNEVLRINDRAIAVIKDYAANYDSMTDGKAKELTRDWLNVEKSRLSLKLKYVKKFDKVLSAAKVARAMQLEQKLDALQQVGIARTVPLIQPKEK